MVNVLVALVGALVGFLSGLLGKGGSSIATPLLSAAGVAPGIALASPLPATVPGTLAASWPYVADRIVNWHVVRWSWAFGVPATIAGAVASRWLDGAVLVDASKVAVLLLGVHFVLFPREPREVDRRVRAPLLRLALVAVAVGLISGLLANGGGFLLAPLYVVVLRLTMKEAFACSLLVAGALAIPSTAIHALLGHIDWHLAVVFGATAIPCSYFGARVAIRTDNARLQRLYGVALLSIALATLI